MPFNIQSEIFTLLLTKYRNIFKKVEQTEILLPALVYPR